MNYYLTKSNPNTFRLQDYLATDPEESRWTVCKDAKPGDTLVIGLSGEEAGIYAMATITSNPLLGSEKPDFWVSPEEAAKPRYRAVIQFSHIRRRPIQEENLMRIPELKRVPKLLHRQGAACHLIREEMQAIDRLMEETNVKKPKMTKEQKEARKREKSAIKQWFFFLAGLVGLTLLILDTWQLLSIIILAVLFILCIVFIICLLLPSGWKRKGFLKRVSEKVVEVPIEYTQGLIVLGMLGISLTQMEYIILKIIGGVVGFSGIIYFSVWALRQVGKKKLKES